MVIGVNFESLQKLTSTTENTEHYLHQLALEGHQLEVVTSICEGLDMYIADEFEGFIPADVVKHLLLFPSQVGTWWDIYNYIRYEI